jgi:serine O-acetyltransferase
MKSENQAIFEANFLGKRNFLNKKTVKYWISEFCNWLFCNQSEYADLTFFMFKETELKEVLIELLLEEDFSEYESRQLGDIFFKNIKIIHGKLVEDLEAVLEFDPAAKSKSEVLFAYPGFFAITVHRIANELWLNKSYILSRLIAEYAHSKTGIDIHPGASIGERFFIDHGTGVVIGETSSIGNGVKIYQGVTLGALSVSKEEAQKKRHPTIQDNVTIYANATILGGNTVIGKESVIGGNVWITDSIPSYSMVFNKSEIIVKTKNNFPESLNFSI